MEYQPVKIKWKNMYTLVLVANVIYVIIFYLITASFS